MSTSTSTSSRPSSTPLTVVRASVPSFKAQIVSTSPWDAAPLTPSGGGGTGLSSASTLLSSNNSGHVVLSLTSPTAVRAAAQEAFYRADSTRTGWLTLYEFRSAMRQLGFALTDSATVHFFRDIDAEGRGKINVEQFSAWYSLNWKVLSNMTNPREEVVHPRTVDWMDRLAVTEAENRRLNEENKQLKQSLHDHRLRVSDYESQSNRLYEVTSELQQSRNTVSDLNKQIGGLSAEAVDASRLRNELQGTNELLNNTRTELRETQSHLAATKRRLGDVECAVDLAKEAAHKADNDRLAAVAEREFVLGEKRSLEVHVGALESENMERLHQLESSQRSQRELAAHISSLEKERDELGSDLVSTRASLRRSEQKLGNALLAEQMLSDKIVSLEQGLKQSREDFQLVVKQKESMAKTLTQRDETIAQITLQNAHLQAKVEALERADVERLKELQTTALTLAAAQSKIVTLEGNIQQLTSDLRAQCARTEERTRVIGSLQEQLAQEEITIKSLRADLQAHENIIPDLERTLEQLRHTEAALVKLRSEYDDAKSTLDTIFSLPDPCGVGLKIESEGSDVRVGGLLEDMSALRSGAVAVGDIVKAIDGVDIQGLSVSRVREMIMGRRGTYVQITLVRKSSSTPFDVQLRRGSYGPEFQVVGAEVKDSLSSRLTKRAMDVPIFRHSTGMVAF